MRPTKVLRVYTELPVIRCKHVKRRTLKNVTIKIKNTGDRVLSEQVLNVLCIALPSPGHYMYINAAVQQPGEKATLLTPYFDPSMAGQDDTCWTFYYHMFGDQMGALNVMVSPTSERLRCCCFFVDRCVHLKV